ncbi:MAG: alpha/beta fold hydrolase [Candidatus Hydrogenedentes bacterium]|nr:alpha/beta fold hydrolase [Candidatus Hydrogenedentota bacterium]
MSPPGESLADYLSQAGYDCWAIDLRGTRSSIPPYGRKREAESLDDYVFEDIPAAIETIQRETGYSQVHWVGHSLGGMLLYAYDAAFGSKQLACGVTLGSPAGFAGAHMARPGVLLYVLRYARPALSVLVRALAPLFNRFQPNVRGLPMNWENLKPGVNTRVFFNVFDPNSYWIARELTGWAISRSWRMRNGTLDVDAGMKKLGTPLFAIYGSRDPLTPRGVVQDFFDALPGDDKKMLVLGKDEGADMDYSHIDLAFSKNAEKEVYEPIADWLRLHPIGGGKAKDGDEGKVEFKRRARLKHADPTSEAIIKGKVKPRASLAPRRRKK